MAYLAEHHWVQHRPTQYAAIGDPMTFFQELEDEAANQIDDLERHLAGPDPVGETFGDRLGRYRMARLQAEEIVIREVLMPASSATSDDPAGSPIADVALVAVLAEFRGLVDEMRTGSSSE